VIKLEKNKKRTILSFRVTDDLVFMLEKYIRKTGFTKTEALTLFMIEGLESSFKKDLCLRDWKDILKKINF